MSSKFTKGIKPTTGSDYVGCKVTLAGVLANIAVSQDYWIQIKNLTKATPSDAGIIKNIAIGKDIKSKGSPGDSSYQAPAQARSLTCWHVTLRGSGHFENTEAIDRMNVKRKSENKPLVSEVEYGKHMTVFYRYVSTKPGPIVVIGYGEHGTTNTDYTSILWADGTKTPINLKQRKEGGDQFLPSFGVI
ncbi:hypothetical protein AruPA_11650 [Acidiphilium sp. PA]|uniref:hypothetical protein n=1 Tax=Acidiphilium sp. PA TaxID=2871705 RepID=UPI00224382A1|nr:hypothetical protein [Acidiphilium sp. PA]MCW8307696.1 hypothetical protein [Acidiphilium sp. PA]